MTWRYIRGATNTLQHTATHCNTLQRVVGSLELWVSFAEYNLFYRALLQMRPTILRCLLIVATPYWLIVVCVVSAQTLLQKSAAHTQEIYIDCVRRICCSRHAKHLIVEFELIGLFWHTHVYIYVSFLICPGLFWYIRTQIKKICCSRQAKHLIVQFGLRINI